MPLVATALVMRLQLTTISSWSSTTEKNRVGVLGLEASNAYRQAVHEAHDAGVIPIIPATRGQADDGSWHLRLGHPIPRRYKLRGMTPPQTAGSVKVPEQKVVCHPEDEPARRRGVGGRAR